METLVLLGGLFIKRADSYAVGWMMLAFITAGLAKGMNRSEIAWFFFGVIAGPIALIWVVGSDKVESRCPHCSAQR